KTALQDEFAVVGFYARFVEQCPKLLQIATLKHGFNGARLRSSPDQRFIGPLAEEQLERADNDRLAGAGFAGDGCKSRTELPLQVFDKRQILDPQEAERGGHFGEGVES